MAALTAQFADYVIHIDDKGKVIVEKGGEVCGNTMAALRDIAASAGFTLEPKWNTQSSGKKLAVFLNSGQVSAPKASESNAPATPEAPQEPKAEHVPAPSKPAAPEAPKAPKAQPAAPTEKPDDSELELTPEEMERILKRLDELENLIKKSASQSCTSSATSSSSNGRIEILDSCYIPTFRLANHDENGKIKLYNQKIITAHCGDFYVFRASDGKYYTASGLVGSNQNSNGTTPTAIKEIAEGLGLPVDKEAKKLTIAQQIIERFGHIHNRLYFKGDGNVYNAKELNLVWIRSVLSNQELISEIYTNDAMKIDPSWDDWEFAHKAADYIHSLKRNDKEIY